MHDTIYAPVNVVPRRRGGGGWTAPVNVMHGRRAEGGWAAPVNEVPGKGGGRMGYSSQCGAGGGRGRMSCTSQ